MSRTKAALSPATRGEFELGVGVGLLVDEREGVAAVGRSIFASLPAWTASAAIPAAVMVAAAPITAVHIGIFADFALRRPDLDTLHRGDVVALSADVRLLALLVIENDSL